MGKNNKHKKHLKSERSKVKLKGKSLPKGTNVTNTVFKVRKIIISEQLKNCGENKVALQTQIKDCLSKLRHHNQKICMGSLVNLKSIVNKFSVDIIDNQFSSILKNVAHLATNEDKDIRRESFTVLQALIGPIAAENSTILTPYYDLLTSYLCCAMTHIDPKIQNDSLLLLDVLLKLIPSIITNNYSRILDNFLDMISKLRTESKPERSLTLNLNSRISSVKWRVNVLEKLQLMLKVLIAFMRNHDQIENVQNTCNIKDFYLFSDKEPIYLGLYDNHNLKINELGLFSGSQKNCSVLSQDNILQNKIIILMPLLFETWLEVKLNNTKDSSGCFILNDESTALLNSIMEIIISFQHFVQMYASENNSSTEWYFKKYRKMFINYIVDGFPYSTQQTLTKKNITNRSNHCLIQNIYICFTFVQFHKNCNLKENYYFSSVLNYIKNFLFNICKHFDYDESIYQVVENMLICVFFEMSSKECRNETALEGLLESLIKLFYSDINTNMRNIFFKILCKLSQDKHFHENSKYMTWIQNLPLMLCSGDITSHERTFLTMLARYKNIIYLKSVYSKFANILDTVAQSNDTKYVLTIINILYYLPGLIKDDVDCIKQAVEKCNISVADKCYIKTILNTYI